MKRLPGMAASAGAVAAVLAGCAAGPQPAPDASAPYQLRGVTVGRPAGAWHVAANTPTTLVLRKPAPEGVPSFVMGLSGVSAAGLDLGTSEGRRRAVEGVLVAGEVSRYRIAELRIEPQRRAGADCVTYEAVVEEQSVEGPAAPLILTNQGFICRHPDSITYFVSGAWSERRARDQKPVLDSSLKTQASQFLDSVRFTSL
jgi:hypothetical protein